MQDFGGDRVEKRLGQLGLVMVNQQTDVVQLDLLPNVHGLAATLEFALDAVGGLAHPQVIKLDAFTLGPLLAGPVRRLKPVFGPCRFGAKQAVMPVEPVHHGFCNVIGDAGVKSGRKHICSDNNSCLCLSDGLR
ncbi:hypothetical protein GALL_457020 [mine drainage metagenome]|uniref:Uncharacterized protein n=1 Tax=mine drainage metagenome TaxID=410659 RepID=A0A1J5PXX4_9ZZZZ